MNSAGSDKLAGESHEAAADGTVDAAIGAKDTDSTGDVVSTGMVGGEVAEGIGESKDSGMKTMSEAGELGAAAAKSANVAAAASDTTAASGSILTG